MFGKILIANRGEIACRIIRTARRLGIATVAVHSDADARALHVAQADEVVRIGPAPAAESYLAADRIIAAALETGAEAIHPGYGFLSENPDFVEAVEAAGLVFIGPSARSIRAMGLKDAAKRLMEKAGVPVVPGYHGDGQALVLLAGKAREIGYPVLIKARAGGGGKGMRRVDDPDDFAEALSAARREAKAAFGDDAVLVEKYVDKPRHIEVQVFGDSHGTVVHLFERDCSAQRRHQKVVEEASAPGMTEAMRAAVTAAAVKAAKAVDYRGAGTVEFIADASEGLRPDRFWFMEMNTRLQVEHPVTEMITGVDLVEWQLRVAAGEPLPLDQAAIRMQGHAFEARIYAEDPARGFLPATGILHHLSFPATAGDGTVRVDTGVAAGDAVSPYYDPMIAKLIVHGPDRAGALVALQEALANTRIAGTTTNLAFLTALSRSEAMVRGDIDTGAIGRELPALVADRTPPVEIVALAATAAIDAGPADAPDDPWSSLGGYRHFGEARRAAGVAHAGRPIAAEIVALPGRRYRVAAEGATATVAEAELPRRTVRWPGHVAVFDIDATFTFAVPDPFAQAAEAAAGVDALRAPMPGLVKVVRVARGETVSRGQPLLVLEAMKMEHAVAAPHAGVIEDIVAEGAQVADGTVLVHFAENG